MPKFEIKTSFVSCNVYTIEAQDQDKAVERFFDGSFDSVVELHGVVDSAEEIITIEEVK